MLVVENDLYECFFQTAQQDIEVERETYQQSRQSLDAMYQDIKKKLQEETQMRLVRDAGFYLCDDCYACAIHHAHIHIGVGCFRKEVTLKIQ